MTLALRPYQTDLSDRMSAAFGAGATGVCAVLPTGGGKTAIIASRIERSTERVAVLAHRTELIEQTIATLRRSGVTSIGAVAAKLPHLAAPHARVQVASLQTLLARDTRLAVDRVICDEAHHYADDSRWGGFVEAYGHLTREGYTATPTRGDGKGLRGIFDDLVVGPSIRDLTEMGFLVPFRVHAPPIHLGGKVAQDPVQFWIDNGCAGRRTLVFAKSKVHGAELEQAYEASGYPARFIHEGTSRVATARAPADFLAGRVPVLINVFRLTEGTDLPPCEVVQLCRACDEDITYMQAVGRGARPSPSTGKQFCTVLDMCGATRKHGGPWVPRTYDLDGRGMTAVRDLSLWQCEVCGYACEDHRPNEPCPNCGYAPEKDERLSLVPAVTGDTMYLVEESEAVGPRADADAALEAERLAAAEAAHEARATKQARAEGATAAKKARFVRNQLGPAGMAQFADRLADRMALWHAKADLSTPTTTLRLKAK